MHVAAVDAGCHRVDVHGPGAVNVPRRARTARIESHERVGVRVARAVECSDRRACDPDLVDTDDPGQERYVLAGDPDLDEAGVAGELARSGTRWVVHRQRRAVRIVAGDTSDARRIAGCIREEPVLLRVEAGRRHHPGVVAGGDEPRGSDCPRIGGILLRATDHEDETEVDDEQCQETAGEDHEDLAALIRPIGGSHGWPHCCRWSASVMTARNGTWFGMKTKPAIGGTQLKHA